MCIFEQTCGAEVMPTTAQDADVIDDVETDGTLHICQRLLRRSAIDQVGDRQGNCGRHSSWSFVRALSHVSLFTSRCIFSLLSLPFLSSFSSFFFLLSLFFFFFFFFFFFRLLTQSIIQSFRNRYHAKNENTQMRTTTEDGLTFFLLIAHKRSKRTLRTHTINTHGVTSRCIVLGITWGDHLIGTGNQYWRRWRIRQVTSM